MKPPICHLCKRNLDAVKSRAGGTGDLVKFADSQPLPDGMVGHPHGLEWFCSEHMAAAQALSSKSIEEAMVELYRVFGQVPRSQPSSERLAGVFHQPLQVFHKRILRVTHFAARAFAVAFAFFVSLMACFLLLMLFGAPNSGSISLDTALFLAEGLSIVLGVWLVAICAIFPNIFSRVVPSHWKYRQRYGLYVVYAVLPLYVLWGDGVFHFARTLLFVTDR